MLSPELCADGRSDAASHRCAVAGTERGAHPSSKRDANPFAVAHTDYQPPSDAGTIRCPDPSANQQTVPGSIAPTKCGAVGRAYGCAHAGSIGNANPGAVGHSYAGSKSHSYAGPKCGAVARADASAIASADDSSKSCSIDAADASADACAYQSQSCSIA